MQVAKPKKGYKLVKTSFGKYEEIPEEWDPLTLREVCEEIASGGTPSRTKKEYFGGSIPWVVVSDIKPIISQTSEYLTEEGLKKSSAKLWSKGTIILSTGATVGKVGIAGVELCTKQGVTGLVPKKSLHNFFLAYYLETITNDLKRGAAGATVTEIYKKELEKIFVPLPPLPEQKQIASILSNVDDTLQKTDQIIEQTQRLKTGMMHKLLRRGIGHTKFKKTKIGEIPEKWEIKFLKDICKIVDTPHYTSPSFDNGIPIIRTSDCMQSGIIDYSNTRFTSKEEYEKRCKQIDPDVGDVLFTREAPCGIAVLVNRKEIAVGQRIILLKTNKEMTSNSFLVFFLNSSSGRRQTDLFSIKTTVERVNIQEIKKYSIPLPSLPEQKQISSILSNIDTQIQKEKLHKSNLERLKKGLMQKLLTGQIRVKIK